MSLKYEPSSESESRAPELLTQDLLILSADSDHEPSGFAILYEKGFNLNPSGNEVDYANASILVANIMLVDKLHCQKDLI